MSVISFSGRTSDDEARIRQDLVNDLHERLSGVRDLKAFPTDFKYALDRRVWEQDRELAGGGLVGPMSFRDFIHKSYPEGLGADWATIERLIAGHTDVLAVWTEVTKRKVGNPNRDQESGRLIPSVNNIHEREERPSGTSAEAGLRKLQKAAAEGNEVAQAALTEAVEGRKSVHSACVAAGLRKPTKLDADVRDRCSKSVAEWIVARLGQDDPSPIVSDLFALGGGAKYIAIEIKNLVGEASTMDRAGWGR